MMILMASIQDPIRKLLPGSPGSLTLSVVPILVATVAGLAISQKRWWTTFMHLFPKINKRLNWLVITLIPAAILSATYGPGSWLLTIFGFVSYGIIFLSIIVGFYFPRSAADIRRLLMSYSLVTAPILTGAFIQYFNLMPDSLLIGTKALSFDWVRYSDGYAVNLISGFYRSPDIMGWHAATASISSFNLAISSQKKHRWFWLSLCVLGISALFFCGRRKMFYMLPVFAISLLWMFWQSGRKTKVLALFGLTAVPVVVALVFGSGLGPDANFGNYYTDHAADTYNQLENHGFRSLVDTVRQSGFLGSGLGLAAPGSHHLQVARPKVWQESGPSRIMLELGVPGFCAMIAVVFSLIGSAWSQVKLHIQMRSSMGYYSAGIFSLFFANICSLVVSGQILADPFISSFLGISIGIVLSTARFSATFPRR